MTNELAEVARLPGEGGFETRPYLSRDTGRIDACQRAEAGSCVGERLGAGNGSLRTAVDWEANPSTSRTAGSAASAMAA